MIPAGLLKPKPTVVQRLTFWVGIAAIWFNCSSGVLHADVVVYDRITTLHIPVFFKVLTKGQFLPAGGKRVAISLDGAPLKTILSGGDGMAYLKYRPQQSGLHVIQARVDQEQGQGHLMVLQPNDRAMIVDILGGLWKSSLGAANRADSQEILKTLGQKYPIIYVFRLSNRYLARQWLTRQQYPRSVLLAWRSPELFDMCARQKVKIVAAVGSATVIEKVPHSVPHRFCFEDCANGKTVPNWKAILAELNP